MFLRRSLVAALLGLAALTLAQQQWGAGYVPDQPHGIPVYGMVAVSDAARDWAVMSAAVEVIQPPRRPHAAALLRG